MRNGNLNFNLTNGAEEGWTINPNGIYMYQVRHHSQNYQAVRSQSRLSGHSGNDISMNSSLAKWRAQRIEDLIRETRLKCKKEKVIMKNARSRGLYMRYYKTVKRINTRKSTRAEKLKHDDKLELEENAMEDQDLMSTSTKDVFLLHLPNDGPSIVFYSNGRTAISKTSNGYVAIFDNNEANSLLGYATPSGSLAVFNNSNLVLRLNSAKGMIDESKTEKPDGQMILWSWRETQHMDPKDFEINRHLKVRICFSRLTSVTRVKPNYILFFTDKDESFHMNLAGEKSSDRRAPIVSKLGSLHIESLALESETAKEHLPVKGQTDFTKNNGGERILQKINQEVSYVDRLENELQRLQKRAADLIRNLTECHRDTFSNTHVGKNMSRPQSARINREKNIIPKRFDSAKTNQRNQHSPSILYVSKCNTIPVITDDILDSYLQSSPDNELQVFSVRNEYCELSAANRIAEAHFHKMKRSKVQNNTKIFIYSLSEADDVCQQSLLSSRHNIQAGMVVIFVTNKLLFADWIFNGHGADSRSFLKQLEISKTNFKQGKYFLSDYKFNKVTDPKIPTRRTAWGGHIYQGVQEELPNDVFVRFKKESIHVNSTLLRINNHYTHLQY